MTIYSYASPCPVTYKRTNRSDGSGPCYVVAVDEVGVTVTKDNKEAVEAAVTLVTRTLAAVGVTPFTVTELPGTV